MQHTFRIAGRSGGICNIAKTVKTYLFIPLQRFCADNIFPVFFIHKQTAAAVIPDELSSLLFIAAFRKDESCTCTHGSDHTGKQRNSPWQAKHDNIFRTDPSFLDPGI